MKTDFSVAPVHLQSASRIEAFLCLYFLALLVEALLDRELRQAMQASEVNSIPLYPEGRPCQRPTAPRVFDAFENVQRHDLAADGRPREVMVTELSPLQRQILSCSVTRPNNTAADPRSAPACGPPTGRSPEIRR